MFAWQTHWCKLPTPALWGQEHLPGDLTHLLLLVPAVALGAISPAEEMRACGRCVCCVG